MPHLMMTVCLRGSWCYICKGEVLTLNGTLGYTNCAPCDDDSVFDGALGVILARLKYSS